MLERKKVCPCTRTDFSLHATLNPIAADANTSFTCNAGSASDITYGESRFLSAFRGPLCSAANCRDSTTHDSL